MSLAPSGRIRFLVTGARGATFADVARSSGAFGAQPNDSDAQVSQKFADYAIQENPGFKGDAGPTGPANSTYPSVAGITDAEITNLSAIRADGQGGLYTYVAGDFTGQIDGQVVIASSKVTVTTGAWVLTTNDYVPVWSKLSQVIVPEAYTRIRSGGFNAPTAPYKPVGGASYRLDDDQTSTTATAWRKRSRNGRWFILDEPSPTIYHFGASGRIGVDDTAAVQAMGDYAGLYHCTVLVTPGFFEYRNTIRWLGTYATIQGAGGRLAGFGGARIYIGDSAEFGPESEGTKAFNWRLVNLSIKPFDDHDGAVLVLDFADYTEIVNCDIGPFNMTAGGSAYCVGVETRYVQWVWFSYNLINVNGQCVKIILTGNSGHNENEDHFFFLKNYLYVGKPQSTSSSARACIGIVHDQSRSAFAGMRTFVAYDNHFYREGINVPGAVSGLLLSNFSNRTVQSLAQSVFRDNLFENISFCYDRKTEQFGGNSFDASVVQADGNSYLQVVSTTGGPGAIYYAKDPSKGYWVINNEDGLQGKTVAEGAQLRVGMGCRYNDFVTLAPDFIQGWSFADKEGASLSFNMQSLRTKSMGSVQVASGATTVTVPILLSRTDVQGKVPAAAQATAYFPGGTIMGAASIDRDAATATFTFADPGEPKTLFWSAETPTGV